MTRRWNWFAGLILLVLSSFASAQNTVTFTAGATSGNESVVPVLTWDTMPLADNCVASGDWSGDKGGAGNETLAAITSGATYNLTCEWDDSAVTLSWTPPTQNTDGTPYTDPDGYNIYYGQNDGGPYPQSDRIADSAAASHVVGSLPSGEWYFVATAQNQLGVESEFSGQAMKTVGTITDTQSIGITVNPKPNTVTGFTAQ